MGLMDPLLPIGSLFRGCEQTPQIVTVMPQITGDAVYSGSDLFCMMVYSNELS